LEVGLFAGLVIVVYLIVLNGFLRPHGATVLLMTDVSKQEAV
jgi:hypothetical protein